MSFHTPKFWLSDCHRLIFRSCGRGVLRSFNGGFNAVDGNTGVVKVDDKAFSALDNGCAHLVGGFLADVYGYFGNGKNGLVLHKIRRLQSGVAHSSLVNCVKGFKLFIAYARIGKNGLHSVCVNYGRFGLVLVLVDDFLDNVVYTGDNCVIQLVTAHIGENCTEAFLFTVGSEIKAALQYVLHNGEIWLLG